MVDTSAQPDRSDRERIVEAFLALLTERRFEQITFADIAQRSGVSLAQCRAAFSTTLGVLAAYMTDLDSKVLANGDADMANEPPRERLFDTLMRRLEAMAPHKDAIRSLAHSARCNPGLAACLNQLAVRSQSWMLTSAGISSAGLRGLVRSQGLTCLYANVIRTWIHDDDPGLARTMARLDRELDRGARWSRMLDGVCRRVFNPCGRSWRPRERQAHDPGEQPAVV